jgi:hypothetical protein
VLIHGVKLQQEVVYSTTNGRRAAAGGAWFYPIEKYGWLVPDRTIIESKAETTTEPK